MNLPNYKNGSIVNLMSSLAQALGGKLEYEPLNGLNPSALSRKNIILIVLDGLGYEFLLKRGKGSFLEKNVKQKITSVFPATTASALTTFATGVAPQQHGFTGWFMYLKELGMVTTILPFISRAGNISLGNIKFKNIYNQKSFFEKIKVASYAITSSKYINSEYFLSTTKGARKLSYNSLDGFFRAVRKALSQKAGRKFIYAYWSELDFICHKKGTASKEAAQHLRELNKKIESFVKTIKNATIIITADHGLIDAEPGKIIELEKHPEFAGTLAMPLCGEPRAVYCYVKPSKVKLFENYVKKNFAKCCEMHKSEELIKKNYFGLNKPNEKLFDRIGDYILIMKDAYTMEDIIEGEKEDDNLGGKHGGISKEEMFVPLIVLNSEK